MPPATETCAPILGVAGEVMVRMPVFHRTAVA
jgi:hypothetical protein